MGKSIGQIVELETQLSEILFFLNFDLKKCQFCHCIKTINSPVDTTSELKLFQN